MNRAKIKNDAKKMIEGNLWTILKPMLIVMIVLGFVNVISEKVLQDTFAGTMCSTLLSLAVMPLSYGLDVFILWLVFTLCTNIRYCPSICCTICFSFRSTIL